jgi:transcriptional regulator with XRE-family HTH domain
MDIAIKFGKRVKEVRLSKGLSQGKLSRRLNVDPSYISQIERGFSNLSLKGIEKIAHALDVKIEDLIK